LGSGGKPAAGDVTARAVGCATRFAGGGSTGESCGVTTTGAGTSGSAEDGFTTGGATSGGEGGANGTSSSVVGATTGSPGPELKNWSGGGAGGSDFGLGIALAAYGVGVRIDEAVCATTQQAPANMTTMAVEMTVRMAYLIHRIRRDCRACTAPT
jgi:hypothetical protein